MLLSQLICLGQHSRPQISTNRSDVCLGIRRRIQTKEFSLIDIGRHLVDFTHVDVTNNANGRGNQRHDDKS